MRNRLLIACLAGLPWSCAGLGVTGCVQPGAAVVQPGAVALHVADGNSLEALVDAKMDLALAKLTLSLSNQFQGTFDGQIDARLHAALTSTIRGEVDVAVHRQQEVAASQPTHSEQTTTAGRDARPVAVTAPITAVGDGWAIVVIVGLLAAAYVVNRWDRGRQVAAKVAARPPVKAEPLPGPVEMHFRVSGTAPPAV